MKKLTLNCTGKSGKRSRRRRGDSSEEDIPVVQKVDTGFGEMPEGSHISEEDIKARNKSASNPHTKLDINLDAPLREEEFIPVRKHHEVSSVQEKPPEPPAENPEKAEKRRHHKKHHKKDRDEEKGKEEEKEERRARRRQRKKEQEEPSLLVDMEVGEEVARESKPEVEPTPPQTRAPIPDVGGDDLDFWLTEDAPQTSNPETDGKVAEVAEAATPENGTQPPDLEEEESRHRSKHGKKHRREKEKKRDRKEPQPIEQLDSVPAAPAPTAASEPSNSLLELGFLGKKSAKKELAADRNLSIEYDIAQYNPMYPDQVLVSLTLSSLSSSLVSAMEINLIDSLSIQAIKPPGVGPRDAIALPFQLRQGSSQETQLAFSVNNVVIPQSLKGTLTYMVSSAQGSTSEKLDMRINFPVSSFIHTTDFSNEDLMEVLGSGALGDAVTSQIAMKRATGFDHALTLISKGLRVAVIERVGTGASLYGATLKQHHVCLLVKDSLASGISVSVKSSEQALTQSVAGEISNLV